MRIIAIQEPEIKAFIDKLSLLNFEIKKKYGAENEDLASTIHRNFHYEVVTFFQMQGSDYPKG